MHTRTAILSVAFLIISLQCVAGEFPFNLSTDMKIDEVGLLRDGTAKSLRSTEPKTRLGKDCIESFLTGDVELYSTDITGREPIAKFIRRQDVFEELDAKLFEVDVVGSDSIYKGVCLGFVSSQLVFLQIPSSSLRDVEGVKSTIEGKYKLVNRREDFMFPVYSSTWAAGDVTVSLEQANSLHSMFSLFGQDLGRNRLRYAKNGYAGALYSRLKDLYSERAEKLPAKKDF